MDDEKINWTTLLITLIIAVPFLWKCSSDQNKRRIHREMGGSTYQSYVSHNPTELPAVDMSVPYMGSAMDCRAALLENIRTGSERVKGQKRCMTARIDGDTLWLSAPYFKEYSNRSLVRETLGAEFSACDFAEVRCCRFDAGGQEYWTIYRNE